MPAPLTQQASDAASGLHNTSGYGVDGARIPGGTVDNWNPTPAAVPAKAPVINAPAAPVVTPAAQDPDAAARAYLKTLGYESPDAGEIAGAKAELLSKQQKSPSAGIVGSSAAIVAGENSTKSTVANLTAANQPTTPPSGTTPPNDGTQSAQNASDAYLASLETQRTTLEQRRKDALANIESDFAGQKSGLEGKQNQESGVYGVQLSRMGGFTTSASALGAMVNLNHSHAQEVAMLEQKKQQAIQIANNAIDDKQFALADAKAKEAKDIEKTINDRKEKFFSDSMQMMQESRQQDTSTRQAIDDQLKAFSIVDPSTIDQGAKDKIDQFYGVKGFTDKYLEVTNAANTAKNEKSKADANKALLDLVQSIPQGQKVTMPDGTTYTGMGKAGDITTMLQVDDAGNGHLIAYDKGLQKVVSVTAVPGIGKTAGGAGGKKIDPKVRDDATSIMQINLEKNKDASNKYKADVYLDLRKNLRASFPELLQDMDAKFLDPKNKFFSPQDIDRLRQKGVFYAGLPTSDITPASVPDQATVEGQ